MGRTCPKPEFQAFIFDVRHGSYFLTVFRTINWPQSTWIFQYIFSMQIKVFHFPCFCSSTLYDIFHLRKSKATKKECLRIQDTVPINVLSNALSSIIQIPSRCLLVDSAKFCSGLLIGWGCLYMGAQIKTQKKIGVFGAVLYFSLSPGWVVADRYCL